MQTSVATPLAAAFVVCAISGGLYYTLILDKRGDLTAARDDLRAAEQKVEDLRDRKTALYASVLQQRKEMENATAIDGTRAAIAVQVAALEKERSSVHAELMDAVRTVRSGASGEMIPELRLADGEVLHNVKIQAVTDYEVIANHNLGIARIALSRLPESYKQRFRADVTPESVIEPLPPLSSYTAAATEFVPVVPAPTGVEVPMPPLPSKKPLPRVVPPSHSREQIMLDSYKRSVRILKERIANLEAMERKDEEKGLERVERDRPERFSNDVEQRAREIAQEQKRLDDLARSAEAASNRRQSEIADLKEKIEKYEAEIAKLEAGRYQ